MDHIIYSFEQPQKRFIPYRDMIGIEKAMTVAVQTIFEKSCSESLSRRLVKALEGSNLFSNS